MIWIWAAFLLFVLAMLALDLGVFHRHAHVVRMREALGWSAVWIALGLSFSVLIYFGYALANERPEWCCCQKDEDEENVLYQDSSSDLDEDEDLTFQYYDDSSSSDEEGEKVS